MGSLLHISLGSFMLDFDSLSLACLTISWNLTANDSRVDFANRTVQFQVGNSTDSFLYLWTELLH